MDASSVLGSFLRKHYPEILPRWVAAVRDCSAAVRLAEPALVDHLPVVLNRIADAVDHIARGDWSGVPAEAAFDHAMVRLAEGFDLRDVVTEFFLLRHVLLEYVVGNPESPDRVAEAQLLCWAVDAAIRDSVAAFTAAQQRTLQALDRISAEALASRTLDELFPRLLQTVVETAKEVDVACLLLAEGDRLTHRAAVGLGAQRHRGINVAVGEGLVGRVAAERRPMAATSTEHDESAEGTFLREHGIRAQYAVPLLSNGDLLGVVQIGSASVERFSDEVAALFRAAAQRIAAAVYQAELRDRAERAFRTAELERGRLAAVLDALPAGVAIADVNGRVEMFNDALLRIWGGPPTPSCTADYREWRGYWVDTGEPLAPDDWAIARTLKTGELIPGDIIDIEKFDGGERSTIIDAAAPIRNAEGRVVGGVVAQVDITAQRRAEEALREAGRRKDEFLGMLSHELRNPLSPIRNSLYILERAAPGGEQARRAHAIIDRQVSQLTHLVDDLLDVTRISRGKIRLLRTRLDLVEIARRAVEDHRSLLEEHALEVALPAAPVWVDGDPTRLSQVLGNLIQNAAKFTPKHGKVAVVLAQVPGHAVLEVKDSGVGIDPGTMKTLFAPFSQAERSLSRSVGGLGLGLALVKGLVELHGGEVSVQSEGAGRGARFTVRLPLATRERALPRAVPPPGAQPSHRIVLVIEDSRDTADSLSEVLTLSGHQVAVAYSGEAGLAKARELRPEVVVCDIGLSGMDGYAVASALRREPMTAAVYLIALTGFAQPEDERRALEAGFDAHLAKPPDLGALEQLLARAPALA